ncbi:MAG: hypothetical protein NTX47_06400 [Candidatus Omnitrophica bacterium]|nr:hypothetical protein [Candidatus Omnitrophota bacterium]
MKYCCNSCNLKGGIKQTGRGIKILCLYTDGWYRENYNCGHWKFYDPTLSKYERLKLAKSTENKNKKYAQYLECVTTAGLVSILGSAAIFIFMLIFMIAAFAIPGILQ